MSTENENLLKMLSQYENNNKPKYETKKDKVYDLKNYFTTALKDGENSQIKTVRILPNKNGSPFVEYFGHKIQVNGENKVFACLKHEKNEACPFCDTKNELLSTGDDKDKEIAKKYSARLMYIVKVIDRDNEEDGVKFWRFAHDYRKEGIYDKIIGVMAAIKKDITDATNGRDIVLTINRNQNKIPIVSSIVSLDSSPLSTDEAKLSKWLSDERTWEDVFSVRTYDYLEIIIKGGTPIWDKENSCFIDKASLSSSSEETDNLNSELTIGLESIKSNLPSAPVNTQVAQDVVDDLPF